MGSTGELPVFFVVFCTLRYASLDEARAAAAEALGQHIQRSHALHDQGELVMAGAFLDMPNEPLRTMAVLTSREAAETYLHGDPFYLAGMMQRWEIRAWANMFAARERTL
jgi:uncharacterized protein YciI